MLPGDQSPALLVAVSCGDRGGACSRGDVPLVPGGSAVQS